jgi:hypothetical protein
MTKTNALVLAISATVAGLLTYRFALEVWCWAYGLLY